jgi:hypothetical protein
MAGIRRVKGRAVCATVYDLNGRAHIRHPLHFKQTVCGRHLEQSGGKPTVKSCGECSEGAAKANEMLRTFVL